MGKHRRRRRPRIGGPPHLSIPQILAWADEWHARTGAWPKQYSGAIPGSAGETWHKVQAALCYGIRGLPGGSSLARLLAAERGVRNMQALPALTKKQILAWADAHFQRTGCWPNVRSGAIVDAPGETWKNVDGALKGGSRGLPGGYSLARLLRNRRGVRVHNRPAKLTRKQILGWADAHHRATGKWPNQRSGPIADAPGETWQKVNAALQNGCRGLPSRSSLARLLQSKRGVRNQMDPPDFTYEQILTWADAHFRRTGRWPTRQTGSIADAPKESWREVAIALRRGERGLPGDYSLGRLLLDRRGVRNRMNLPDITYEQILAWADVHFRRTGRWPTRQSGAIADAPQETWKAVANALERGNRGLPGRSSLARLLRDRRGVPFSKKEPFTEKQILGWADTHHRATGEWPNLRSGPIPDAPGETWQKVHTALQVGVRGLPGGSSLARLLHAKRAAPRRFHLPA